jgi:hypothetical protein
MWLERYPFVDSRCQLHSLLDILFSSNTGRQVQPRRLQRRHGTTVGKTSRQIPPRDYDPWRSGTTFSYVVLVFSWKMIRALGL